MIITEFVFLNRNEIGKNKIKYYKNLNYNLEQELIKVYIKDLPENNESVITAKCDFCNSNKEISYKNYNRNKNRGGKFTCSKKCSILKTKSSNLEKYGVENPNQSDLVKKKKKKTNIEKWGSETTFQSKEIKEKIKKTNLERYGVQNPFQSKEIKEKIKKTNLERYGFTNASKSEEIKNKVKEKCLEKWGSEYFLNSKYFLENIEIKKKSIKNRLKSINNESYRSKYYLCSDINYIKYLGNSISLFKCDCGKNHEFEITSDNYRGRKLNKTPLCTVCNPIGDSKSIKEKDFFNFINSIYDGEIIQSYRNSYEIDIYLPRLNLGFEFNGLYWHSEERKDKFYHINKTKYFEERGIHVIHIWEDDWDNKRSILESQIKNWLGLTSNKVFARKCKVREIKDSKIVTKFLEENHIQGGVGSSLKLGLYYEEELISLMIFDHNEGREKMELGGWNISRFCNKLNHNVLGGASKLFKYFLKNYEVKRVISYADRDWSTGNLYKTLGFERINESDPDYKYLINGKRVHKSRFRKSNTGITENELKLIKVWNSGKIKFIYT